MRRVKSLLLLLMFMIVRSDGEQECNIPLGMETGAISDAQISASSQYNVNHAPRQGRLHYPEDDIGGGWAASSDDANQWLAIDLRHPDTIVTRIASQGRNNTDLAQWVTSYKLQWSNDGVNINFYRDEGQAEDKVFAGNTDTDSVVYHELNPPITTRYVRFLPVTWNNHISMRVELFGCPQECKEPLGVVNGGITDSQMTASSSWNPTYSDASKGRMYLQDVHGEHSGAWVAASNNAAQWLEIDLINRNTRVTRVATQGRNGGFAQWVTKYKLQYSNGGSTFYYYREQGQASDKEFAGNTDQDTVVSHDLNPPIWARYIRFRPTAWYDHISLRVELYGCLKDCQHALGMESGEITDAQITASSEYDAVHRRYFGRLHFQAVPYEKAGGWAAGSSNVNQWLQIDLLLKMTVTRVATQGRNGNNQRVTKYKLQHGNNGEDFQFYMEHRQSIDKEFAGNTDQDSVVYHELNPSIRARFIRFVPVTWNEYISMRAELYGCVQGCTAPAVGMETGEISDSQITASSGDPSKARLNKPFVWCPATEDGYIQINLSRLYRICAVATQGYAGGNFDYLKEYKVSWSKDGVTWDTSAEALKGNVNWRDVRKNDIPVIYARYFRLLALKWFVWPCTRMEVYGEPWPEVSDALFAPTGIGKALSGHVISTVTVADVIECMKVCLVTEQCKSFNFSNGQLKCEVSSSKAEGPNLEDREGFDYYQAVSYQVISTTPSD